MQQLVQVETLWVGRVDSVDTAEGVGGKDAGMARFRSAPKPSLELVGGPGVIFAMLKYRRVLANLSVWQIEKNPISLV